MNAWITIKALFLYLILVVMVGMAALFISGFFVPLHHFYSIYQANKHLLHTTILANEFYIKHQQFAQGSDLDLPPDSPVRVFSDGRIQIALPKIQTGSLIEYYPSEVKASIHWKCFSNLSQSYLPENCSAIKETQNVFKFHALYALGAEFEQGNLFYQHQYLEPKTFQNALEYTPQNTDVKRFLIQSDKTLVAEYFAQDRRWKTLWFSDNNSSLRCMKGTLKIKHKYIFHMCYPHYDNIQNLFHELKPSYKILSYHAQELESFLDTDKVMPVEVLFDFYDAQQNYTTVLFKMKQQGNIDILGQYYLKQFIDESEGKYLN